MTSAWAATVAPRPTVMLPSTEHLAAARRHVECKPSKCGPTSRRMAQVEVGRRAHRGLTHRGTRWLRPLGVGRDRRWCLLRQASRHASGRRSRPAQLSHPRPRRCHGLGRRRLRCWRRDECRRRRCQRLPTAAAVPTTQAWGGSRSSPDGASHAASHSVRACSPGMQSGPTGRGSRCDETRQREVEEASFAGRAYDRDARAVGLIPVVVSDA